jgi:hypothetical protein
MQGAVFNHDRRSVTSGRECIANSLVGDPEGTRATGNLEPTKTATTARGWMGRIVRTIVGQARQEPYARRESAYGTHHLGKGWLTRARFPNGGKISCKTGGVWITADDGGEDIVLSRGDFRWFRPGAWVLIEAIANSEIVVEG